MGKPAAKFVELPKVYDPRQVESRWYRTWQANGCFRAAVDPQRQPYCIVIPPPNVTGALHIGHALNNTLQDVLVRWRRMQGYAALWLPGTDHAGIATQHVVEEELAREGTSRHELGREQFLERVWAWKEESGGKILNQLKRLGASCDWERERFTMDEGCSRAVREVFVRLFERGLIYQGNYIVNWCPTCQTTLSDIEVEHEERAGKLWHLKYPLSDGSGFVVVATTRPETMLGDTAVAVHPKDERYRRLVGKTVRLPLMEREIPVIADEAVDPEFGTGMVKVTPAHDPNDFEMGLRNRLPQIQVIGQDARMTEQAGPYASLDRYACREAVVRDLEARGLLLQVDDHEHAVGGCYRCNTVVEPLVSKQWFVRMKPLAEPAIAAVRNGDIRFIPDRFAKNYLHWMENVRDWCISRQLWWGHRIPVWTCADCGEVFAAGEDPAACRRCGGCRIEQDPDVLDTWFSSALWPFSTLGWPDDTADLRYFYPTSTLVTAFDIIYFWVARMIFMGLAFMKEKPFRDVLIHGLVRDALGRKMSKTLGNGVDPLQVIEEYGADALRFTLVTGVAPGNDTRYDPEKAEASRNFCNKIWNASRFALMHLADFQPGERPLPTMPLALADRWILSRLDTTVAEVTRHLERYDLGEGARTLYDFVWSELCDWYIELIKPRLYGKAGGTAQQVARDVLWHVLSRTLALLHPYIPFITEEIWQHLPHEGETLMLAPWPEAEGWRDEAAEEAMGAVMEIVRAIRNVRAEKDVPPSREIAVIALAGGERARLLRETADDIKLLARIGSWKLLSPGSPRPQQAVALVAGGAEIYLPLAGLVDIAEEKTRLQKELAASQAELERVQAKLRNDNFVAKAPPPVVAREREKETALVVRRRALEERLQELR